MIVYVPLILYELDEEDSAIADGVLNWYYNEEDAKMMHPDASIIKLEVDEINPQDN